MKVDNFYLFLSNISPYIAKSLVIKVMEKGQLINKLTKRPLENDYLKFQISLLIQLCGIFFGLILYNIILTLFLII